MEWGFLRLLLLIISSYDILDTWRRFEWIENRSSKKKIMAMRRRWCVIELETGYKAKTVHQIQLSSLAVTTSHVRPSACVMWVAFCTRVPWLLLFSLYGVPTYKKFCSDKSEQKSSFRCWEVTEPQLYLAAVTQMLAQKKQIAPTIL